MSDRPTIATRSFDLEPWVLAQGASGDAPHFHQWASRDDPINQLRVEWSDERHEVPVAVSDIDGCRAVVKTPAAMSAAASRIEEAMNG